MSSLRPNGIENRRWNILRFRGNVPHQADREGLIEAKEPADILFLNGSVDGSPGCGGWVGTYSLKDGYLSVHASEALAGMCTKGGAG